MKLVTIKILLIAMVVVQHELLNLITSAMEDPQQIKILALHVAQDILQIQERQLVKQFVEMD